MKDRCGLNEKSHLIDIGAGLGRPLLHALLTEGIADATGYELDEIKCMKAEAFLKLTARALQKKGLTETLLRLPKVHCTAIEKVPCLDPATHAYSFWEGVPPDARAAFGRLFAASRTLQSVTVVQRAMQYKEGPAQIMEEVYDFCPLVLVDTLPVTMSGSQSTFRAYIFNRAQVPARLSLHRAARGPVPVPEAERVPTPPCSTEDYVLCEGSCESAPISIGDEPPCEMQRQRVQRKPMKNISEDKIAQQQVEVQAEATSPRFTGGTGMRSRRLRSKALAGPLFPENNNSANETQQAMVGAEPEVTEKPEAKKRKRGKPKGPKTKRDSSSQEETRVELESAPKPVAFSRGRSTRGNKAAPEPPVLEDEPLATEKKIASPSKKPDPRGKAAAPRVSPRKRAAEEVVATTETLPPAPITAPALVPQEEAIRSPQKPAHPRSLFLTGDAPKSPYKRRAKENIAAIEVAPAAPTAAVPAAKAPSTQSEPQAEVPLSPIRRSSRHAATSEEVPELLANHSPKQQRGKKAATAASVIPPPPAAATVKEVPEPSPLAPTANPLPAVACSSPPASPTTESSPRPRLAGLLKARTTRRAQPAAPQARVVSPIKKGAASNKSKNKGGVSKAANKASKGGASLPPARGLLCDLDLGDAATGIPLSSSDGSPRKNKSPAKGRIKNAAAKLAEEAAALLGKMDGDLAHAFDGCFPTRSAVKRLSV